MSPELINLIVQATGESLYMVGLAALIGTAFGLPLGVFLATSRKGELFAAPVVNRVLGIVVNATRSTPSSSWSSPSSRSRGWWPALRSDRRPRSCR